MPNWLELIDRNAKPQVELVCEAIAYDLPKSTIEKLVAILYSINFFLYKDIGLSDDEIAKRLNQMFLDCCDQMFVSDIVKIKRVLEQVL